MPVVLGVLLLGAMAVGYFMFWADAAEPDPSMLAEDAADAAQLANVEPVPGEPADASMEPAGLTGSYGAAVADQDVSLTFNPGGARPLEATFGVAHYFNRVASQACSSMIAPIQGDLDDHGQAFDQSAIAGLTPCGRNIRVRIAFAEPDGSRLSAVWTDPVTGAELMRADLAARN